MTEKPAAAQNSLLCFSSNSNSVKPKGENENNRHMIGESNTVEK
ncbi:MAG: hypothetical protein ACK521_01900 [bacterium]